MKPPREILLGRHSPTEAKLDAIRKEVVQQLAAGAKANREFTFAARMNQWFAAAFRELLWRPRWTWSGLAAAWVIILAANIHLNAGTPRLAAQSPPNTAEFILTLREQERVIAELTGKLEVRAVIAPGQRESRPRSEATIKSAMI